MGVKLLEKRKCTLDCVCLFALCLLFAGNVFAEEAEPPKAKASASYRLSVLDQLSIQVLGELELSTSTEKSKRIDANGFVNIPMLGDVKLQGLTVREAEVYIEKMFVKERYLVNPQVSIDVWAYYVRRVSVLGEVNHPGAVEFREERHTMDIAEVIALAGGFTGVAKSRDVLVTRIDKSGQKQTFTVDVIKIVRGREDKSDDETIGFEVYADDVVFVPERLF